MKEVLALVILIAVTGLWQAFPGYAGIFVITFLFLLFVVLPLVQVVWDHFSPRRRIPETTFVERGFE